MKISKLMAISMLALLTSACATAPPTTVLYVSASGKDTDPGTAVQPLATLDRARDVIRGLRQRDERAPMAYTVMIAGDDYRISHTFALEAQDSGTADAPVIYSAAPGETAQLIGGEVIPGAAFMPVADPAVLSRLPEPARGKVMQVNLNSLGITDYGQIKPYGAGMPKSTPSPDLFVDGESMTLARRPNDGWAKLENVVDRGSVWESNVPGEPELREKPDRGATFELADDRLRSWAGAEDAWLYGYWWWDWADSAVRIAAVDPAAHLIKTVQPHAYGFRAGGRYYAFNLLEELDVPGEWYLDRQSGILYLYPSGPLAAARIELSLLDEAMVRLDGASHVRLQGLTMEATRGAAIVIRGGAGCTVAGCTIRKTSDLAVDVEGGTDHRVVACDIYDTNGGIRLTGGDRRSLAPGGHAAANNLIHDWTRINKTGNPAIRLSGVGQRAEHNRIYSSPHAAIEFDGNDHIIEFNDLSDVCRQSNDAGVIYAGRDWTMRGNIIRYNYIHDISGLDGKGAVGIYLDDAFSGAEVTGNVLCDIIGLAFLLGGGRDNVVDNNITINAGPLCIDDRCLNWAALSAAPGGEMRRRLAAMPYREEPWRGRYPKLTDILEDEPAAPKGNIVRLNVFMKSSAPRLAAAVRQYGVIENNWATTEDPGFIDEPGRNFGLAEDARVYAVLSGFKPIPFDRIGLVRDEFRSALPP